MNITIERLKEIENERAQTSMDPAFREWLKQFNVSRLHSRQEGIDNARRIMADWDPSKILKTVHTFNFTK